MTTRPDPPPAPTRPRRRAADRAGLLLALLVFTYLLSAFTTGRAIDTFQVVLFLAVVLISLRNGPLSHRSTRIAAGCLLAGSILAAVIGGLDSDGPGAGVADIWKALILLLAAVLIVRRVLARPEITLQSIYGALSAYLILGLMYAACYAAMYLFGGHTFFAQGKNIDSIQTFQYFSFVTLTTTGYGDFTAAASGGQAVAVLEAITGQIFLATLVARLVAGFRGAARRRAGPASAPDGAAPDGAVPDGAAPASAPASSGPAGARRARTRRASSSGLTGLRPPGTARRRQAVTGRSRR